MSSPTPTSYAGHSSKIITVSTTAELNEALTQLNEGTGGTIRLSADGGPYTIWAKGVGGADRPILIEAEDPKNPPVVEDVEINDSSHITLTGLHIEAADENELGIRGGRPGNVVITGSDSIEFIGNTIKGTADDMYTEEDARSAVSGGLVQDSTNVVIAGNTLSNLNHGFGFLDVKGFVFSHNELYELQGDGLRGGGLQDAIISSNYMHDFFGSTQTVNHSDMIQLWGSQAELPTRNVEISYNILDSGDGAASQSIFIRNEDLGDARPAGAYFEDIRIFENLVHNAHYHGITAADTKGLEIYNNTVLWNQASFEIPYLGGEPQYGVPRIDTSSSPDADVYDNIANKVLLAGGGGSVDNYIIDYVDPSASNYFHAHFANSTGTGGLTLYDLVLLETSPLFNTMGASYSSYPPDPEGLHAVFRAENITGDRMGFEFSASESFLDGERAPQQSLDAVWVLEDGTVLKGLNVNYSFETSGQHVITLVLRSPDGEMSQVSRIVEVGSYSNLQLDFSSGVSDVSGQNVEFTVKDDDGDALVAGRDGGTAFHLNSENKIVFSTENAHLYALETLQVDIGFKLTNPGDSGIFFRQQDAFRLEAQADGSLKFVLKTSTGAYTLETAANVISDTKWHDVKVKYDGPQGKLKIIVDGEVAATMQADGVTPAQSSQQTLLGDPWGRTIDALVDEFEISSPRSAAAETNPDSTEPREFDSDSILGTKFSDDIQGTENDDVIYGLRNEDVVLGKSGNDKLVGNQGDDIIRGGTGQDILQDRKGADLLYGGKGADRFRIAKNDSKHDTIADFQDGKDIIDLRSLETQLSELKFFNVEPGTVKIKFQDDVLIVQDGGIGELTAASLTAEDFLF